MYQYSQGRHTTQGHKGIPDGFFEEEQGRKGFFGPVSHLIKEKPSTRWSLIDGPLKPQLFDSVKLPKKFGEWQRMLYNNDCAIYYYWLSPQGAGLQSAKTGFRNADGETIYFIHAGGGVLLTEYGSLEFRRGHYVVVPKCVTHTMVVHDETQVLVVESRSGMYREPDRGMVGRNAFYDSEAIVKPNLEAQIELQKKNNIRICEIFVKRCDEVTRFKYDECYYDTVGWKGDFYPFTLHVDDMMPMLSARVHLPPSAHTTFAANGFVICTFLPRPLETDADALKVPFYHQNIDYDEVIFYHDGNFFSRDNFHAGLVSLHPAGFPHGPHPKAVKNTPKKTHTDEYAVMIDTWNKLHVDQDFGRVEVADYWKSWISK